MPHPHLQIAVRRLDVVQPQAHVIAGVQLAVLRRLDRSAKLGRRCGCGYQPRQRLALGAVGYHARQLGGVQLHETVVPWVQQHLRVHTCNRETC